jgi:hypothetical protein
MTVVGLVDGEDVGLVEGDVVGVAVLGIGELGLENGLTVGNEDELSDREVLGSFVIV